ncbi:hypothetical protein Rhe02_38570 [Rhizocola hellebori]|uniref:Hsp70 family protein n=1 Tax=Rhizocola hellebori TaxID=1392758 RepID=A0A8J3Q8F9_9ACTN|nr:Hsp70 family protein [Rhizocola hellebori]GIH05790.1 hypothetical protein Rhe02_38570 [Rhizocola hellebori]
MTQSILVVDFGNYETTAALVTEDQIQAIACPPAWNSHLDIHYLRTVVDAATTVAHSPIDRLSLTIPTSFGRDPAKREAVVAMAAEAGFADVELISDSVAAMLDPHTRPELPDDALVLLCDLGVTWSTTLIRLQPEQPLQLAEETAAESLTRAGLDILTDSALRWLTASCRAMVARANLHLSEVDAVVLVGGGARLPIAGQVLHAELGRPVLQPADPEFAVVRGAASWAAQATNGRAIKATPAAWRVEPLSWPTPDRARVLRWLVAEGQPYPHGACLAQVRTPDDRVYDLTALREGIMVEHRVRSGDYLPSGTIAAMARSAMLISNDRPTKHLALQVSGEWMLTADRRNLVEYADSGAYVRMRAISSGAVVEEVCPVTTPQHGRVFVRPGGQLALVSWDDVGHFAVWEVPSGRLMSQFQASATPLSVRVHEGDWRLVSEVDRKVSVGRYRRDVATMWDLGTGAVVDEIVGDDLGRRFTGFVDRSAQHGFAAEVRSPDGRLRAGSTRVDGHAAVWLHQADTDEELFRTDVATAGQVRSAFSADGHYLLNRWSTAQTTRLDVWKI